LIDIQRRANDDLGAANIPLVRNGADPSPSFTNAG
jgi:hypothetical protein